jgi:hypothetical protein
MRHENKVIFSSLPGVHSKVRCRVGSGSGWVVVVSIDRGEQGGSNGTKFIMWLWILRWLGGSEDEA